MSNQAILGVRVKQGKNEWEVGVGAKIGEKGGGCERETAVQGEKHRVD